ncbi:dephospho-CoA kinase [Pedobacter sp. SD-b]|uniref:Dephospho-CoA kinase n=2 Tax=Pedobacter segetis TaxID=2793069 RepID=A0ABS1BJA9_9SPHI|nr:dephospho-CoA kinase [Pedobacter segetis]MBK0382951.1 dephospho-CoA kinase [Pedobacter segetis]
MFKVGITGGIGSGKTTVCKIFELLHIPVFYADDAAKELMISDGSLMEAIRQNFGSKAYLANGNLNRKHIANQVFNSPEKLNILNSLVHPKVFEAMDIWSQKQKSPYVTKEAALLFESRSYLKNNINILVSSPLELRIKRIMLRDRISNEKVQERINNQLSEAKKQELADYIVYNNEVDLLIPQVLKLHRVFLNKAQHT